MKTPVDNLLLKYSLSALLLLIAVKVQAQDGTYELKNKNGSYNYISFQKKGDHVRSEIFAWWNTASAQTGSYYGTGVMHSGKCTLQSGENAPECKITLILNKDKIQASFANCTTDHLTEDFNGIYTKITNATAGDYIISVPKSWFHKKPDATTKLQSYVIKGDKVTLNLDRVIAGNWVNVYYIDSKGKETSGYINLADLQKAD